MTLLCIGIFKINLIFTLEFLALLAGIWFLAYASKEQLNKWYRYAAIFVITVISAIILCTAVNMFCLACGGGCGAQCGSGYHQKCGFGEAHGGSHMGCAHHSLKGHKECAHHKKMKKYHHSDEAHHEKMKKHHKETMKKESAKADTVE